MLHGIVHVFIKPKGMTLNLKCPSPVRKAVASIVLWSHQPCGSGRSRSESIVWRRIVKN